MAPKAKSDEIGQVQSKACSTYARGRRTGSVPTWCHICEAGANKEGGCRWKNFRLMGGGFRESETMPPTLFTTNFKKKNLDKALQEHALRVQARIAPFLIRLLRRQLVHYELPDLVTKGPEKIYNITCDRCKTAIFSASFLCEGCAYEVCIDCRYGQEPVIPVAQACTVSGTSDHHYLPVVRYPREIVKAVLDEAQDLLKKDNLPQDPQIPDSIQERLALLKARAAVPKREVPRIYHYEQPICEALLSEGYPVVVVDAQLTGPWGLDDLKKVYGQEVISVIEINDDGEEVQVRRTLKEFLTLFVTGDYYGRAKDIPASEDFSQVFQDLANHFESSLSFPDLTSRYGVLNMPAHWPKLPRGEVAKWPALKLADLGPKMYAATADRPKIGSTKSHLDMSGATNILVYAAADPRTSECGAAWDLFKADDADRLSTFLRGKLGRTELQADPKHGQDTFIDDNLLRDLRHEADVWPFRIVQKQGEVMFIPPGVPHQVSNLGPCIKVATDFVGVEGFERILNVDAEFRREGISSALQPTAMLWHFWQSLTNLQQLELSSSSGKSKGKRGAAGRPRDQGGKKARLGSGKAQARSGNGGSAERSDLDTGRYYCPDIGCRKKLKQRDFVGLANHLRTNHDTILEASELHAILDNNTLAVQEENWLKLLTVKKKAGLQ